MNIYQSYKGIKGNEQLSVIAIKYTIDHLTEDETAFLV